MTTKTTQKAASKIIAKKAIQKATAKKAPPKKAVAQVESPTPSEPTVDPCANGHQWDTDGDGVEHCKVCLADRAVIEKPVKAKGKKEKTKAPKAPADSATTPATKKPKTAKSDGKLSALDAAAKVLSEANEPLNTKQMIEAMAAKGLWTSPGGKTPHATLYSAILREIATKGNEARFKKTDRGHFAAND